MRLRESSEARIRRGSATRVGVVSGLAMLLAAGLFGGAALAAVAAHENYQAAGARWWGDIEYLASDKLEGRMTGTKFYQEAADYVAKRFAAEGLKPIGTDGFFQPVKFESRQIDEAQSSLALVREGKETPLVLGEDAVLSPAGGPETEIEAPAVFVGYGVSVPEAHYDDLAGLDLQGKIAVYLTGGPSQLKDPLRAHAESRAVRWAAMRAAGAIGAAAIPNTATEDIPWKRMTGNRHRPSLTFEDASLRRDPGMKISFLVNPADADKFFAGTGHTLQEVLAAAKADKPLPKFPLAATIRARVKVDRSETESPNVAGVLEGSDPELKKQYVIVSAHLDHLGVGAPVKGDDIYNGAMDNASGVAALIEVAREFRVTHTRPKRSVIFLALCGEEEGELGSWYFSHHPSVPGNAIAADLNMDMFLPLFPLKYLQVQGLAESTIGDDAIAVGKMDGIDVIADEQPAENRFIRSDQYSFVQTGVPAVAFKFGFVKGSEQEKIYNNWVHTRYHQPSDDLGQPVDKTAAGKFCNFLFGLTKRVADDSARPTWEPTSFFRRFAKSE